MSPRAEFIDALFDRLTLRYDRAFLARWEGLALGAVKADWARELAGYADQPGAIEHALNLLSLEEPPTAARFRELCGTAPAPVFRAGPEPKEPQRAAEVRRNYLRPVAPRVGGERAWAADLVRRADAGKCVFTYNLRVALDALRRQGSRR